MDTTEARQLASTETTSPEILEQLATSQDDITRKNVAENPNSPKHILYSICWEFPQEVLHNSVIPLLLLEDPSFLTCKISLNNNFNNIKHLTDIEIKRLGWTKEQGMQYLQQHYGKRSRLQLSYGQLLDFLNRLRSL